MSLRGEKRASFRISLVKIVDTAGKPFGKKKPFCPPVRSLKKQPTGHALDGTYFYPKNPLFPPRKKILNVLARRVFLVAIKRLRRKTKHLPANQNWKKYLAVLSGNRLFTGAERGAASNGQGCGEARPPASSKY